MAYIQTDILGKVFHFYEMSPIIISHLENTPLRVKISTDDSGIILDESYWPDFNGLITIDIKDIVSHELSHSLPEIGYDIQQNALFKVFHISIGEDDITGDFTVNGYSSDARIKMTDVDLLRIPTDYQLPLSLPNMYARSGIKFCYPDGTKIETGGLVTSSSGIGATSRMIRISDHVSGHRKFHIELDLGGETLKSAEFEIVDSPCEQYIFANRYGGFDNIPMFGTLEFLPEMTFESGSYSDRNEQVMADSEYTYSQNSGYMSRKVMELASELLCCSQIYHLDHNGEFRRIVILDSTIQTKSSESLHSFSFRYKYADDTRPLSLKGKSIATFASGGGTERTLVSKLESSPATIVHGKNKMPCVTVVDINNQVVETEVNYLDMNTIVITWNGNFAGYAYIN